MFSLFKPRPFFSDEQKQGVVECIRAAEKRTSGEIRLFVESKCRFLDPLDRAAEIFFNLEMDETKERNAVLLYIALKDRQLAIFGDKGIHAQVGTEYWNSIVKQMLSHFKQDDMVGGICTCVTKIGEALYSHFPYNEKTDKNELPDEIVFGK